MIDDEGRCRFRCRTNREAYIEGFVRAWLLTGKSPHNAETLTNMAVREYRQWRRETKQ